MSPQPPSPSDDSGIPLGSRPNLGITAKDSTELDLWEFDDVPGAEEVSEAESQKPVKSLIPSPRHVPAKEIRLDPTAAKPASMTLPDVVVDIPENIRLKMNPKPRTTFSSMPSPEASASQVRPKSGEDFDDLDQWEEPDSLPELPVGQTQTPTVVPNSFKDISTLQAESSAVEVAAESSIAHPSIENEREEFSGKSGQVEGAAPLSIRPDLNLKPIERIGLGVLLVLLLGLAGVFYFNTILRIPSGSSLVEVDDFPIQGNQVAVASVETYWREPVTAGPDADTVRRDILLIPIADFATQGGPTTIRVFFRDSDGTLVGDAVTRTVQGEQKFKIAATSGFDDMAKHAAYRTGQSKPWTLEVLEGPSGNAPTSEFKRLFKMNISSDRK